MEAENNIKRRLSSLYIKAYWETLREMNFDKGNGLLFVFGINNPNKTLQEESREYADEVSKEALEYAKDLSDREMVNELKQITRNYINNVIDIVFENFREEEKIVIIDIDLARMQSVNRLPI